MDIAEQVRAELRKDGVKLWEPPYNDAAAVEALAKSYSVKLGSDEGTVSTAMLDLRQHALEKLAAKTRVTLVWRSRGACAGKVQADEGDTGASVRGQICHHLGVANSKIIAGGQVLQDHTSLQSQGWCKDRDRGGQPLRVVVIPESSSVEPATSSVHKVGEADVALGAEGISVTQVSEAAKQLTAEGFGDFELADASTGRLVSVPPAARQALVTALAMHARGRELMENRPEQALEFLIEADRNFEVCRHNGAAQLLEQLGNYGELQLDICWAYAVMRDMDCLPDAEARLEAAERMIRRQVDRNFLTLAEVKADQGHTLPPEVIPSVRLWLLRGLARRCRNVSGAQEDLARAQLFMQGLRVNEDAVNNLMLLGGTRAQATAALRRCEGDPNKAAEQLLASVAKRHAERRERATQRKFGQKTDGSFVDPDLVKQMVGMGLEDTGPLNELAIATLLSMGFEQAAVEGALRTHGGVEEALLALTAQVGTTACSPEIASENVAEGGSAAESSSNSSEAAAEPPPEVERPAKRLALDRARAIVERELGQCLRRDDADDEFSGATMEKEEVLLQEYLSGPTERAVKWER